MNQFYFEPFLCHVRCLPPERCLLHWFTVGVLGKTGTLATRPGVTWLVPLAPTQPSDARPCPLTLPVTALIWLGMVWRPLPVCPVSSQARFGLEAGDSHRRSRCIRRSLQLYSRHTVHWTTETTALKLITITPRENWIMLPG